MIIGDKTDLSKVGIKSVPTLSAHSVSVCIDLSQEEIAVLHKARALLVDITVPLHLKLLLGVLLISGCRISEVLVLKHEDIDVFGNVSIKAKKGSLNRVVFVQEALHFKALYRDLTGLIFEDYSRFTVRRLFIDWGLYCTFSGNENKSVTHIFRHLYARQIMAHTGEIESVKSGLGHKSQKSTQYYTKVAKSHKI